MTTDTLAIDFGTSNSAAAIATADGVRRIPIERGAETLPTAVFFPTRGRMRIGADATDALIDGEEGRYMRALKSALGLPLLHEKRMLGGAPRTLSEVITAFLKEARRRAEADTGHRFTRALSGRPVHFHSDDAASDAQAEEDLRDCYRAAGFDDVAFLAEPEAAALAASGVGAAGQLGLIVDIGGGTSDFSVFRTAGGAVEILASHGVRLGGTDFDHAVSMARAMPMLGLNSRINRELSDDDGTLPIPRGLHVDLATWARIPFLYTPEARSTAEKLARLAVDGASAARLVTVLKQELGHELAFAVENGKIDANAGMGPARIEMGFIEPGLSASVAPEQLDTILADAQSRIEDAIAQTLRLAERTPDEVGRVILVGGSSLMGFVSRAVQTRCPSAEILRSDAFTAVVDGLALAAAR